MPMISVANVLVAAMRFIWNLVRLPLLASLLMLEPLVRAALSLAVVLGVLAAIVFGLSAAGARFEILQMLAISLAFGLTLFFYNAVLALLSR